MDKLERQRATNLWEPFARKFPPVAKACRLKTSPEVDFDGIGGLLEPKDEIQTYACAITDPQLYRRWGTVPPTALALIGPQGCGKTLLAEALASRTGMPFLVIDVPRFVLQVLHTGGPAGPFLSAWSEKLDEMPRLTVMFRELDFLHSTPVRQQRELPVGSIVDFLLELLDETIGVEGTLTVGSTARPDALSPVLFEQGRFERVVSVNPLFPDDVIEALRLHAGYAEQAAGRPLFDSPDWKQVVEQNREASIGDWVRLVHGVLRRKARCDATDEVHGKVTMRDLLEEVDRAKLVIKKLPLSTGRYL